MLGFSPEYVEELPQHDIRILLELSDEVENRELLMSATAINLGMAPEALNDAWRAYRREYAGVTTDTPDAFAAKMMAMATAVELQGADVEYVED